MIGRARGFMPGALRLIAFAIAIAGLIDPAISVSGASRARLAVVVQPPRSPDADGIRDRLTRDLSASYEIVSTVTSDAAAAIVIGDRYPDEPAWSAGADPRVRPGVPDSLLVATVTTADVATSGVRIVRVDAPQEVPAATVIHLDVEIEGLRVAGRTTDVTVAISGLESGRASHRWTADEERWRVSLDAVPVGDPPFVLRVEATVRRNPDTTEAAQRPQPDPPETTLDARTVTAADALVDLRLAPFRVQFFDPRPSWATTFVRRALERDARFDVASLSVTSRGISAQTGGDVRLDDPRIDGFDVVIVGALDRLSAADVRSLDRYMRERGGALVLVPDQRIDAGPARDLAFGGAPLPSSSGVGLEVDLIERLLEQPAKLAMAPPAASPQASELLVLRSLAPGTDVIARIPGGDGSPVIVSMPRGGGRLLLSGAMDAWRFRAADNRAFDRFWQATIASLALASPPPIAISVVPPLLLPGERGEVIVRVRSRDVTSVSASLDGDQPIRLRPEPELGVYRGSFRL